jgi:hypothetical protein
LLAEIAMERERERERERSKGKVERFSSIIYLFRGDMLKTTTDGRGDGACKSLCPLFKYKYQNLFLIFCHHNNSLFCIFLTFFFNHLKHALYI